MKLVVIPDRVALRALRHFELDAATGCHISRYSLGSHGYPQVGWQDPTDQKPTMTVTHRAAWVAVHGQVDRGMTVDHICHNRRCVNVAHLRLLTNYDNATDGARVRNATTKVEVQS